MFMDIASKNMVSTPQNKGYSGSNRRRPADKVAVTTVSAVFDTEPPPLETPMRLDRRHATLLLATLLGAAAPLAQAQTGEFPIKGKPIRVIVAFPPSAWTRRPAR
jgi:hypothetical protein